LSKASPKQNFETLTEKLPKAKMAGGMVQVVKPLPSKGQILSSNTNAAKKEKKNIYIYLLYDLK
jgi:hypothetical protein